MALFAGPPDHRDDPHRFSRSPWRSLRALRHQPPGRASAEERHAVFNAALEQSEQLFTAATQVDYATRPILAFYGLSQAGRAIAAAANGAGDDDWLLSGHGIKAKHLHQEPPISQLILTDHGRGSFGKVAELLSSATLPQDTELSFLWACIPELQDSKLDGQDQHPNALTMTIQHMDEKQIMGRLKQVPDRLLDTATTNEDVAVFLDNYPDLGGYESPADRTDLVPAQPQYAAPGAAPEATLLRTWPTPEDRDPRKFVRSRTRPYRHEEDRWVFPAPPGQTKTIHPLIAWWAILYALSMLARYQPSSWIGHLNVDKASTAVPLELALDAAVEVCPELILQAIGEVTR